MSRLPPVWNALIALPRVLLAAVPLLAAPAPASAQPPPSGPAASGPAAAGPAAIGAAIAPDDARRVLNMLNDPARRAEFAATLATIAKTLTPAPAPANAGDSPAAGSPAGIAGDAAALAIPLKPDSLGADLLISASAFLGRMSERVVGMLAAIRGIPPMSGWLIMMASDPLGQALLLDTAWRLAVTIAAALGAEFLARRFLRRPIAALRARERGWPAPPEPGEEAGTEPGFDPGYEPEDGQSRAEIGAVEPAIGPRWAVLGRLRRLPEMLPRLLAELAPVLCSGVVGHLVASSSIGEIYMTRLVLLAVIDAYVVCRVILTISHWLLAPDEPKLRLFPVDDATAVSGLHWVRRLTLVTVVGYALAEVGLLLGMSQATHEAALKMVGLASHLMLVIIVLRNRDAVAALIRAPVGRTGSAARWRRRLASVWHVIVIFYIAALWLVWAVEIPHGYVRLMYFVVVTTGVFVAARLVLALLLAVLERLLPRMEARGMAARDMAAGGEDGADRSGEARSFHPLLHRSAHAVVTLGAAIAMAQLWGLGIVEWLRGTLLGQRMLSAMGTTLLTVILAILVWEFANGAVERHLQQLQKGAQAARSARLRTLLPMLRTALLVTIMVVVGMVVLSEIGVNIAPLLAGAGVLGIAIGFGSQKLVQDVITGLFLLLENTMQVGDVVTLGGLNGVVEHLSIRTIRLRSENGSVHVIPFSAVSTVTNMTRDFSQVVIEAQVAYKDSYDDVVEVLRQIVREMREEPLWQGQIRNDLEVWGLDRFADSGVVIKCRILCGPFGRWAVGREFNRRMKLAFEAHGIEIPYPHQKLIVDEPAPAVLTPHRAGGTG